MSTPAQCKGYLGPQQLPAALQGCQLVVIPAGVHVCMRHAMLSWPIWSACNTAQDCLSSEGLSTNVTLM